MRETVDAVDDVSSRDLSPCSRRAVGMLLRQRVGEVTRAVRDSDAYGKAEKLWRAAGSRPLLIAAVFALALLGLISIASAWRSMGSRGGGTRVQGLKMVKAAPGRQLIDAAFAGNQQAVVRLLKAGKIVGGSNYQDERGRTALMAAAEGGHGGVVAALLTAGAGLPKPSLARPMPSLTPASRYRYPQHAPHAGHGVGSWRAGG